MNLPKCRHCGLPATLQFEDLAFCCPGCKTAFTWLQEANLGEYYELRESTDPLAGERQRSALREHSDDEFAYLDDEKYLTSLGLSPGSCKLNISGLHCPACVWLIERLPEKVAGLDRARVSLAQHSIAIDWNPETLRLSHFARLLQTLGYTLDATDERAKQRQTRARRGELLRIAVTGASMGNVMLISLALYTGQFGGMDDSFRTFFRSAGALAAFPAVSYGAWPFLRAAWSTLRLKQLHIDLPISIGILLAYLASLVSLVSGQGDVYFDSVSALVFLLLLGRFFQSRGQSWAYSKAGALNLLLPPQARVWKNDAWMACSRKEIQVGDRVWVQPGERIAADGICESGFGSLDCRSLTGESRPEPIKAQSMIIAGSISIDADFVLRVVATDEQTRIGKLAESLDRANDSKSQFENLVDRLSGIFVAVVLLTASIAGLYWYFVSGLSVAFNVVLATLVVSCPCALGLATPLALTLARARAAESGILFARSSALEELASIPLVAFDKTGTLTLGRYVVTKSWSTIDKERLKSIVATLEAQCVHPVARGLRIWSETARLDKDITSIREVPSSGITAVCEGKQLRLGRFHDAQFDRAIATWPEQETFITELHAGKTVVYLEQDGVLIAAWSLEDEIDPNARALISKLRSQGRKIWMLSGDAESTVAYYAKRLGVDVARGAMQPEDKLEAIRGLRCAMIGDGVNDAPALKAATVGIAVGGSAEIAMRVADVYLAQPTLAAMQSLFEGARRTRAIVRRNIGFALVYNIVFAGAAVLGKIDPLIAAIAMPASSLTVLLSSWGARSFIAPIPNVDDLNSTPR